MTRWWLRVSSEGDWGDALPSRERSGRFAADDRAASAQVGAIILFGFVMVSLVFYQAEVVPADNQRVEYNHNQLVRDDMVDVRNAIMETRQNREKGYASVDLGAEYPSRSFAVNPPNPAGTIRTTGLNNYTVRNGGGAVVDVCPGENNGTRFLTYEHAYNELQDAPDVVVDNTVVYETYDDGTIVTRSGQDVVDESTKTLSLVPIVGEFSQTRTSAISVEPEPGGLTSTKMDNPTLTAPTRLDNETWVELLEGEVEPGNVSVDTSTDPNTLTLELGGTDWTVECGPTGINTVPPSGDGSGGVDAINPAAPGDIKFLGTRLAGPKGEIELQFRNQANDSLNVTEARINFYHDDTGKNVSQADVRNGDGVLSTTLFVEEDYRDLDPQFNFTATPTNETTVSFRFFTTQNNGNVNPTTLQDSDWFVLTLVFETGQSGTYFVGIPDDTSF